MKKATYGKISKLLIVSIFFLGGTGTSLKAEKITTGSYKFIQTSCVVAATLLTNPDNEYALENISQAHHCHAYLLGMHAMMKTNCDFFLLQGGTNIPEFRAGGNPTSAELVVAYTTYAMSPKAKSLPSTGRHAIPIILSSQFPCEKLD